MVLEKMVSENCGLGDRRTACMGRDETGQLLAWIDPGVEPGAPSRSPRRPLCLAPDERLEAVVPLLAAWPAWELARLAAVELGSRVLVVAEDVPIRVLTTCRAAGCSWLGLWGATPPADLAVDLGTFAPALPRPLLPGPLDAALLLQGASRHLLAVLPILRSAGRLVLSDPAAGAVDVNTYPDIHRRGLVLRALAVDASPTSEAWAAAVPRLRGFCRRDTRDGLAGPKHT